MNEFEPRFARQIANAERAYAADAAGAPTVKAALDILRAATGADFRMGEFGISTAFESGTPSVCHGQECGCAEVRYEKPSLRLVSADIHVSSDVDRCGTMVRTLVHEIIHTLVPVNETHAADGVFAEKANGDMRLRGESLDIL